MAPAGIITSGILGGVLFLLVLSTAIFLIYFQCFCVYYVRSSGERFSPKDVKLVSDETKKSKFIRRSLMVISPFTMSAKDIDLENHPRRDSIDDLFIDHNRVSSKHITSANHIQNTVCEGDIIIDISKEESTEISDYRSAIESMDNFTNGLLEILESRVGRSDSFSKRKSSSFTSYQLSSDIKTITEKRQNMENSSPSDQYDSFSRTLMLQKMPGSFKDNKSTRIMKVRDPFSDSFIVMGGIVVIVTPFHGKEEGEFTALQPGDLIRIVNFYFKNKDAKPIKSIHCISKEEHHYSTDITDNYSMYQNILKDKLSSSTGNNPSQEGIVDRFDPFYDNIYCTGIIMNTYLEYNSEIRSLALKFRRDSSVLENDNELLKEFPLRNASLETTVLRTMIDSPEHSNSFQAHFM